MRGSTPAFLLLASTVVAACGSSTSPTGPATGGATSEDAMPIGASARLAWHQPAASALQAQSLRYRLRVDGASVDVNDVTCEAAASGSGAECSAPMPRLPEGRHVLSLVAINSQGAEGPPSATLVVTVAGS
jgi:hypothetical protein